MTGLDAISCSADAVNLRTNKTLHFVNFGSLRAEDFFQTIAGSFGQRFRPERSSRGHARRLADRIVHFAEKCVRRARQLRSSSRVRHRLNLLLDDFAQVSQIEEVLSLILVVP